MGDRSRSIRRARMTVTRETPVPDGEMAICSFSFLFPIFAVVVDFFFRLSLSTFFKTCPFFYYSIFIIIIIGCARFRRRTFHEPNRERANYLDGLNALIQTPIIIPAELKSKGENAHFDQTAYKMRCNNLYIWFGT